MVGNRPQKCKLCDFIITHGNTKRHNARHHPSQSSKSTVTESGEDLEPQDTLSAVLEYCGVPQKLWPARREVLDRLQNYRLLERRTTAFDMPGEPKLQIVDDTRLEEALPTFEELIVQVAAAVGKCGVKTGKISENCIVCFATTCVNLAGS